MEGSIANSRMRFTQLSYAEKREILEKIQQGKSQSALAREYGCSPSAVSKLNKRGNLDESVDPNRKRRRMPKNEEVDKALWLWFDKERGNDDPINGRVLAEKARQLAQDLVPGFEPSTGWIDRWKVRHGVKFIRIEGRSFIAPTDEMVLQQEEVKTVWRNADAVCFDVDSTVCTDEAIDEFAKYLGVGEEVAELTKSAMSGGMTYKESFTARLDIMKPTRAKLESFLQETRCQLTRGIREVVAELQMRNADVYLVSGGFTSIIRRVASELNIPKENIFANKLLFDYEGDYAGFDENQPTCESGGKPRVVEHLKEKHGYKNVVMIGDGVTDMEACPPADAFIGFGGNQVRQLVKDGAGWFVYTFSDLLSELQQ